VTPVVTPEALELLDLIGPIDNYANVSLRFERPARVALVKLALADRQRLLAGTAISGSVHVGSMLLELVTDGASLDDAVWGAAISDIYQAVFPNLVLGMAKGKLMIHPQARHIFLTGEPDAVLFQARSDPWPSFSSAEELAREIDSVLAVGHDHPSIWRTS